MNSRDREVIKLMIADLEYRRDRSWGRGDRSYYVDRINALKNALNSDEEAELQAKADNDGWNSGCGGCGCG